MQTDPLAAPAAEIQPQPQPAVAQPDARALAAAALAEAEKAVAGWQHLFNPQPTLALQPTAPSQLPTVVEAPSMALAVQHRRARNGRIAQLPKTHRDMVNRMLANSIPYKNIGAALERLGYLVKERNISNWATGGYLDWQAEQETVRQIRFDQDHLLDNLRRDDASELSEVGLQAAATRLSQLLVQKAANAENLEANLPKFSQMVRLLSGITHDLATLQKQRDAARRTLGSAYDVNRVKNEEQKITREMEDDYSYPEDAEERGLALPDEFPLVPFGPTTSEQLERQDEFKAKMKRQDAMALFRAAAQNPGASLGSAPKSLPNDEADD
jgi:hypothetical protein